MTPSITLGLGTFIAHFIPGAVFLGAFLHANCTAPTIAAYLKCIDDHEKAGLFVLFLAAYASGLVLDAVRHLCLCGLALIWKTMKGRFSIQAITKEDFEVYSGILEMTYRFHQLWVNLGLALFASLLWSPFREGILLGTTVVLGAICCTAGGVNYYQTIQQLRARFPEQQ